MTLVLIFVGVVLTWFTMATIVFGQIYDDFKLDFEQARILPRDDRDDKISDRQRFIAGCVGLFLWAFVYWPVCILKRPKRPPGSS